MANKKELINIYKSPVFNALSEIQTMINDGNSLDEILDFLKEEKYSRAPAHRFIDANWDLIKSLDIEKLRKFKCIRTQKGYEILKIEPYSDGNILHYNNNKKTSTLSTPTPTEEQPPPPALGIRPATVVG